MMPLFPKLSYNEYLQGQIKEKDARIRRLEGKLDNSVTIDQYNMVLNRQVELEEIIQEMVDKQLHKATPSRIFEAKLEQFKEQVKADSEAKETQGVSAQAPTDSYSASLEKARQEARQKQERPPLQEAGK